MAGDFEIPKVTDFKVGLGRVQAEVAMTIYMTHLGLDASDSPVVFSFPGWPVVAEHVRDVELEDCMHTKCRSHWNFRWDEGLPENFDGRYHSMEAILPTVLSYAMKCFGRNGNRPEDGYEPGFPS